MIHLFTKSQTTHFILLNNNQGLVKSRQLLSSHFLYSLFDDGGELLQDGEVGQDLEEDGQRVPDLHVVLRLQAHNEGLGNPEATNMDILGKMTVARLRGRVHAT